MVSCPFDINIDDVDGEDKTNVYPPSNQRVGSEIKHVLGPRFVTGIQ